MVDSVIGGVVVIAGQLIFGVTLKGVGGKPLTREEACQAWIRSTLEGFEMFDLSGNVRRYLAEFEVETTEASPLVGIGLAFIPAALAGIQLRSALPKASPKKDSGRRAGATTAPAAGDGEES